MTYKAPDKSAYDWWFDQNIPKAQYGSLQCWIANEKTQPWSNACLLYTSPSPRDA